MQYKLLLPLFLSVLLSSCGSDKEEELPSPIPTSHISLKLAPVYTSIKTAEVIISEQNGKKLLDTVLSTLEQHTLAIQSREKDFVVTTLVVQPTTQRILIDSYVQVNPHQWVLKPGGNIQLYASTSRPPFEKAKITYLNVPSIPDGKFYFTNSFVSSVTSTTYSSYARKLEVNYEMRPANYTYFLIPSRNEYKIVQTQDGNAAIDLSQMDQAVKLKFKAPAHLTLLGTDLFGYPVADDYNNFLWLYFSYDPRLKGDFDVIYPSKHIKEFKLSTAWADAANNTYEYNSLADSIPTHLSFIDDSHVKVNSKSFDLLQVEFLKGLPTYYASTWVDSKDEVLWRVYSPPSKTSFNAKEFVRSLGSTLLQGKDVTNLKLTKLVLEKVDNLAHQPFFNHLFAEPNATNFNKLRVSNRFTKKMD